MPTFDTTSVPGIRVLTEANPGNLIDDGLLAMAQDLARARGAFHAWRDGSLGTLADGAMVRCNTEVFDVSGCFDPSTGIYTVPWDGVYRFKARLSANDAATMTVTGSIGVSPSGTPVWAATQPLDPISGLKASVGDTLLSLTAGQQVAPLVNHNKGSAATFYGNPAQTFFQGQFLGRVS